MSARAPRCTAAAHRDFDFWLGSWEVRDPEGKLVGHNRIESAHGGCVLIENWTSTSGVTGTSVNLYDRDRERWHQTWVDASGSMTHYVGDLEGDKMVLVSQTVTNGKRSLGKMTFSKLPDGNVRQHGEASTDDGKTWTTTFDFKYVRVK